MRKCLIWGIGHEYEMHYNQILFECLKGNMEILALVSKDKWTNKMDGYNVIDQSEIDKIQYDYILIMVKDDALIIKEALNLGIQRNKLIRGSVLDIPGFDFNRYCSIRESNMTIISENCWGGVLSHLMDLEFRSPFVNCHMDHGDYLTLLENLDEFMKQELICERECDIVNCECAIGTLEADGKKVRIFFNHHSNFNHAKTDWDRRKKKINKERLFVKMEIAEYDHELMQRFDQIQMEHKVCFVTEKRNFSWEVGFPYYVWRSREKSLGYGCNTFILFSSNLEKMCQNCDILKMFNGETDFRRME